MKITIDNIILSVVVWYFMVASYADFSAQIKEWLL